MSTITIIVLIVIALIAYAYREQLIQAAMFIGILMLSGLAYAAFHIVSQKETQKEQRTKMDAHAQRPTPNAKLEESDTIVTPQPKLYDNVPLGEVLEELSDYYHVKVVYRNEDASRRGRNILSGKSLRC